MKHFILAFLVTYCCAQLFEPNLDEYASLSSKLSSIYGSNVVQTCKKASDCGINGE
jgi:hypothetical protein